jgi:hypothetical protein
MQLKANSKNQLTSLFLLAAVFLFIYSLFLGEQIIDIHLHDTFFVISTAYVFWALAIFLILCWALYKLANSSRLIKFLTWIHLIATLIFPFLFAITIQWRNMPHDDIILAIASLLFVAGQIAFLINIIGGLARRFI